MIKDRCAFYRMTLGSAYINDRGFSRRNAVFSDLSWGALLKRPLTIPAMMYSHWGAEGKRPYNETVLSPGRKAPLLSPGGKAPLLSPGGKAPLLSPGGKAPLLSPGGATPSQAGWVAQRNPCTPVTGTQIPSPGGATPSQAGWVAQRNPCTPFIPSAD